MKRIIAAIILAGAAAAGQQLSEESEVRDFIRTFAEARNSGVGTLIAALYSENGEWMGGTRIARGREALAKLWADAAQKAPHVERNVESVDLPSRRLAIVHVATDYGAPIGRRKEVFVLVREAAGWRIRVHESLD